MINYPNAIAPAPASTSLAASGILSEGDLAELIRGIVAQYPEKIRAGQMLEVERFAFHVYLVYSRKGSQARVCDIGGGWGTFAVACAAVGMDVVLIDDFRDSGFFDAEVMTAMRLIYEEYGVAVHSRDILGGVGLEAESFDAITSFDCFEHLHHSPKQLVAQIRNALRRGGVFVLGVPNCVNLRKRITVPFGLGKWSSMEEWYDHDVFRGHVREADVDDLRHIARDMKLADIHVYGRNWKGYISRFRFVRALTPFVDRLMRLRATLCSDIYIVGTKV
jgi:SAM-dependent methyltransferase